MLLFFVIAHSFLSCELAFFSTPKFLRQDLFNCSAVYPSSIYSKYLQYLHPLTRDYQKHYFSTKWNDLKKPHADLWYNDLRCFEIYTSLKCIAMAQFLPKLTFSSRSTSSIRGYILSHLISPLGNRIPKNFASNFNLGQSRTVPLLFYIWIYGLLVWVLVGIFLWLMRFYSLSRPAFQESENSL